MDKLQLFLRKVRAPQLVVGLVVLSFLAGCGGTSMGQQNPYLLTGAGLGAATGAALGIVSSPGNPWRGAAIGGLLGTAVGGVAGELYGRSCTQSQPQQTYYQPQPQSGYYGSAQPNYSYQPQQGYH